MQPPDQKKPVIAQWVAIVAFAIGTNAFRASQPPAAGFDVRAMLLAGLVGGLSAAAGWALGKVIEDLVRSRKE